MMVNSYDTTELKMAYLDGKAAKDDMSEYSIMLMQWYEEIASIQNKPEIIREFLRGWKQE
jgi:hypothetical protein